MMIIYNGCINCIYSRESSWKYKSFFWDPSKDLQYKSDYILKNCNDYMYNVCEYKLKSKTIFGFKFPQKLTALVAKDPMFNTSEYSCIPNMSQNLTSLRENMLGLTFLPWF